MKKYYTILSALLLLTACSGDKVDFETMSAEEIYNYAMDEMEKTRYAKAETAFETIETDHPYSQWAVRSKLMGAYAYYKDEKYDDAIMAVDRFIKYHPGNKDVPYALYLKGMCYYDQISAADRDQGNTEKAAETFAVLMTMYPESEYAKDASGKMNLTEDYKAGQEMNIGRYYLHEGNYLSALNRFNVVLENYQKTIQIEEALYREVEIYAIFGMNKYANGYYKILKQNYPDGKWTAKAEKVINKIGVETKPAKKQSVSDSKTEDKAKEDKSWFSSWFGGNDDKAEEKQAETAAKVAQTTEEVAAQKADDKAKEDKSWFSGWFGGNDDKVEAKQAEAEAKVTEAKEEIAKQEAAAKEDKSWFSGWFGGSDEITKDMAESKKAANDTINETLDSTTNKTEESAKTDVESPSWYSGLFGKGTLIKDESSN